VDSESTCARSTTLSATVYLDGASLLNGHYARNNADGITYHRGPQAPGGPRGIHCRIRSSLTGKPPAGGRSLRTLDLQPATRLIEGVGLVPLSMLVPQPAPTEMAYDGSGSDTTWTSAKGLADFDLGFECRLNQYAAGSALLGTFPKRELLRPANANEAFLGMGLNAVARVGNPPWCVRSIPTPWRRTTIGLVERLASSMQWDRLRGSHLGEGDTQM